MRKIAVVLALIIGASLLAACSGGGGSGSASSNKDSGMNMSGSNEGTTNRPMIAGAPELAVTADAMSFTPKDIALKRGEGVNIALTAGDLGHDLYVKGVGHVAHAAKGATVTAGLRIDKPGTYPFWCTVRGHKDGGMVGTVTVT